MLTIIWCNWVNYFWCDLVLLFVSHCYVSKPIPGEYCEEEVNECLSNPCYNGAYCVDSLASFSCDCLAGFDGSFCEMEINECMSETCLNGAECHDLIADYRWVGFFWSKWFSAESLMCGFICLLTQFPWRHHQKNLGCAIMEVNVTVRYSVKCAF